jgi:hypothetical protein
MAKVLMLERGFDFEEIYIATTYSEPYLELSPWVKSPVLKWMRAALARRRPSWVF